MRILPREEPFIELFTAKAAVAVEAARELEAMLRSFDDLERRTSELRFAEHRAHEIGRDINLRLENTFITPFDREEIHALGIALRDLVDLIEEIGDTFSLFPIDAPTATSIEQVSALVRQCEQLGEALPHLRSLEGLEPGWTEVFRLRDEAVVTQRRAMADLFSGRTDPLEVVKWKRIYELEMDAIDRAADVAMVLKRIVVKNA
jgi:uncharacterized protein Yka (UPF0111/DUF47 family)